MTGLSIRRGGTWHSILKQRIHNVEKCLETLQILLNNQHETGVSERY